MTRSDAPFEEHTISAEQSAQKRMQAHLSERRPTAKQVVQRPPQSKAPHRRPPRWLMVLFLLLCIALIVANVLLISAMMFGAPTAIAAWLGGRTTDISALAVQNAERGAAGETATLRLRIADNFNRPVMPLAQDTRPNQWDMGYVRRASVYRMRVWPGHAAWSVLNVGDEPFRLETSVTVAVETPQGYAGLLGRFQDAPNPDEQNTYLFAVDGQGRYQVLLAQVGVWTTLQPWTDDMAVRLAGESNVIVLEDDGSTLRFLVNDAVLFETTPRLPPGSTGLAAGAPSDSLVGIAEVNFDRLSLYELVAE